MVLFVDGTRGWGLGCRQDLRHIEGVAEMNGVAPQEKDEASDALEKRLWGAIDQMRAKNVTEILEI